MHSRFNNSSASAVSTKCMTGEFGIINLVIVKLVWMLKLIKHHILYSICFSLYSNATMLPNSWSPNSIVRSHKINNVNLYFLSDLIIMFSISYISVNYKII